MSRRIAKWSALGLTACTIACGSNEDGDLSRIPDEGTGRNGDSGTSGGSGMGGSSDPGNEGPIVVAPRPGMPDGGGRNSLPIGPDGVPIGFTKADTGAWRLGDPFDGSNAGSENEEDGCGTILGLVRDFRGGGASGHPDFETFTGDGLKGIVSQNLGNDQKPVYAHDGATEFTTSKENFDQWYRNFDGVNSAYFLELYLVQAGANGAFTFESNAFFPLDGTGLGDEGRSHNYHFTTEVHTHFRYAGGERFRFKGDDDLWVFLNRKLAIDLGGLHSSQEAEILLDDEAARLEIEVGNVYSLDLFHAERHTQHSNFRIDTNLDFVDCGVIVPEVVQ